MTCVIGLIGAPKVGKDEVVSKRLVEKYNFKRLAFADKIKELYYKEIGITEKYFKDCCNKVEEKEIRNGLWKYSDKMRKIYGNLYFITPVITETLKEDKVIITDIRTQNELYEVILCTYKPKIFVVIRGDIIKEGDNFPGTRISYDCIQSFLRVAPTCFFEFRNNFNTLDEAYKDFDNFYENEVIMGRPKNPDF
jgi:hypothetical protein